MRMNTDIFFRFCLATWLLYAPLTWLYGGDSVASQMNYLQPDRGLPVILLMAVVSVVIYIDVFLNSMLNCNLKWQWVTRHRNNLYTAGGFLSFTVLYVVGKHSELTFGSIFFYVFLSLVCMGAATIDALNKRPCSFPKLERRKLRRD